MEEQQQIYYNMSANAMLLAFVNIARESIVLAACSVFMQKVRVAEKTR